MEKTALLFAGQGAQYIGMGRDIYEKYPFIRELYDKASVILGYDLAKICFTENNLLNQTRYTQPAIMVTSYCLYRVLTHEAAVKPRVMAGFSLGEYTALCAADVFDFDTAVKLINYRAIAMDIAAAKSKGAMAAIIGYPRYNLESLCKRIGNVIIANYNYPGQLVVSGHYDSVESLCDAAKQDGARRTVMLNVSGAFHSPLMAEAADRMEDYLGNFEFHNPSVAIIMNGDNEPLKTEKTSELMVRQITSPIYFEDIIRKMIKDYDINQFIEIGPGNVLSGFVKKINNEKLTVSINKIVDCEIYTRRIQ